MKKYQKPISIFLSYALEDEQLLLKLETHLSLLKRQGLISTWCNRQIIPGDNRVNVIDEQLEQASIILLLISSDFLASDYCYSIEMQRALQQYEAGQARVIPLFLRPVDWEHSPFTHLQGLPRDGKAITEWDNQDIAFRTIAQGLRQIIESISPQSTSAPGAALPPIWNIPYSRNLLFTGRGDVLAQIATTLSTNQLITLSQPHAISGLGGIGKTQIAIEYAYLHRQEYQAVLWTLANTRESLISGYIAIAALLNLPLMEERDQMLVVNAVLKWFKMHTQWLLILDNADDLTLIREFLPSAASGHILFTTRAHAMGQLARRIEVETMDLDVSALFLLHRAGLIDQDAELSIASPSDITVAKEIAKELGGLPLALDQAGAYVEETQCSLSAYQQRYYTRRAVLLKRRGGFATDHPESVTTTFSLAFEMVGQQNLVAADLLRFCAFLSPDAIPEEVITEGAMHLGPVLEPVAKDPIVLDDAIAALSAYSLVHRDATNRLLRLHRLVQAVLKDEMTREILLQWIERTVQAVKTIHPQTVEVTTWPQWERCLPLVLSCHTIIEHEHLGKSFDAAMLFSDTGFYLYTRARYIETEQLFKHALAISEELSLSVTTDTSRELVLRLTTNILHQIALFYDMQGKYSEAEPLYKRALTIQEQQLELNSPATATSLKFLADLYTKQGKYSEAEQLYKRALTIQEQQLELNSPVTVTSLHNLADLYTKQGKYSEAEPLYNRALTIQEQQLGTDHPDLITSLYKLAALCENQGRYEQAQQLYKRALIVQEQQLGADHPSIAASLLHIGYLYRINRNYAEAEPFYRHALAIYEQQFGVAHPTAKTVRVNYTSLLRVIEGDIEARKLEESP